jgi:hypothetical protein
MGGVEQAADAKGKSDENGEHMVPYDMEASAKKQKNKH